MTYVLAQFVRHKPKVKRLFGDSFVTNLLGDLAYIRCEYNINTQEQRFDSVLLLKSTFQSQITAIHDVGIMTDTCHQHSAHWESDS